MYLGPRNCLQAFVVSTEPQLWDNACKSAFRPPYCGHHVTWPTTKNGGYVPLKRSITVSLDSPMRPTVRHGVLNFFHNTWAQKNYAIITVYWSPTCIGREHMDTRIWTLALSLPLPLYAKMDLYNNINCHITFSLIWTPPIHPATKRILSLARLWQNKSYLLSHPVAQ